MSGYWFHSWMERHRVTESRSLRRALAKSPALRDLLASTPHRILYSRPAAPDNAELVGFGIISLPDQAVERIALYETHGDVERLAPDLESFVLVLARLQKSGALTLVRFDVRMPPCQDHFRKHAVDAGIDQAFDNAKPLAVELASSASISWELTTSDDHPHLDFTLQSPQFEHTEWGSLCSARQALNSRGDR